VSSQLTESVTLLSVLTPVGRGAVAVVAVAGPQAVELVAPHFSAANGRPLSQQAVGRVVYGRWGGPTGEDLVACRTAEETVEIHCHGGSQSVATIVEQLKQAGGRELPWHEWVHAKQDVCPLTAAAQVALASARSLRTARILLDQTRGALRDELTAIAELLAVNSPDATTRLKQLLARSQLGLHLTRPWQVVIAGNPNVGKSSLINALVGYQRAIVFDQPGTTRDVVTVETLAEGWPLELSDTAGLHTSSDELELAGIELAQQRLARADLVVWVLDATRVGPDTKSLTAMACEQAAIEAPGIDPAKLLVVLNKVDRLLSEQLTEFAAESGVLPTSATTPAGIETLLAAIAKRLVPEAPLPGAAVPFLPEQVALLQTAVERIQHDDHPAAIELLRGMLGGR